MKDKPETQIQSYNEVKDKLPQSRLVVLSAIVGTGDRGLTLFELVGALGVPVNRISGRVTELSEAGLIVDSKRRRMNPETNKTAIIWTATVQTGRLF